MFHCLSIFNFQPKQCLKNNTNGKTKHVSDGTLQYHRSRVLFYRTIAHMFCYPYLTIFTRTGWVARFMVLLHSSRLHLIIGWTINYVFLKAWLFRMRRRSRPPADVCLLFLQLNCLVHTYVVQLLIHKYIVEHIPNITSITRFKKIYKYT